MTDEKTGPSEAREAETSPAAPSEPSTTPSTLFGVPLEAFVRGQRSRPAAHERMLAEEHADAERRRDIAAQERAAARKPIAQGGAMLYQNKFQESPDASESFFDLAYVDRSGDPIVRNGEPVKGLADVTVLPDGSVQFHLVCPKCMEEGLHQDRAQMRVNSRNRKFEVDFSGAGTLIMFNDGFGMKPYRSAGVIRETERLVCSQCGWACRIVKNVVRPE